MMKTYKANSESAGKNLKRNFLLPIWLSNRTEETGKFLGMKFSQVVRTALEEFIKKVENEKLKKEMIEACKFYYSVDREIADEWRKSEGKL